MEFGTHAATASICSDLISLLRILLGGSCSCSSKSFFYDMIFSRNPKPWEWVCGGCCDLCCCFIFCVLLLCRNYNYGAARGSVGYDILSNPNQVANDPTLAFQTALWFWTIGATATEPTCHDVMVGNWTPTSTDMADGRKPGFGETINIINGGLECGQVNIAASNRITNYENFCSQLNVIPGSNLDCQTATHY